MRHARPDKQTDADRRVAGRAPVFNVSPREPQRRREVKGNNRELTAKDRETR